MTSAIDNIAKEILMVVFDFDGVFTDNKVLILENGTEGVFCTRSDGFGLSLLHSIGIHILVLSTEENPVVTVRCKKLKVRCIQGCSNKIEMLKKEAKKLGIPLEKIAYMGNDINDLECLSIVGLPACVKDSYPEVIKAAKYISTINGGYGAVREFCEYIAMAKRS